jgi:hypothetical protein
MTDGKPPKPQQAGRITDARGRKVRQLDPIAIHLLRQHNVIDAVALQAIVHEKKVRITGGERAALVGGLCGVLLVIGLFTHALISGGMRAAASAVPVPVLYLLCLPWIIWFGIKRKRFGNVAAAMLKHLRCPHCGYDIRMLPVDPADGATICPECGCAWKLEKAVGNDTVENRSGTD